MSENICGSTATRSTPTCKNPVTVPGTRCWRHKGQPLYGAPTRRHAAATPAVPPVTGPLAPTTLAEFESEQGIMIAGSLPKNPATGWARECVLGELATDVVYEGSALATAYLARYRHWRRTTDHTYYVVASGPYDAGRFLVLDDCSTYLVEEDGTVDIPSEYSDVDAPAPRGHATMEDALARARELALTDLSGTLTWDR